MSIKKSNVDVLTKEEMELDNLHHFEESNETEKTTDVESSFEGQVLGGPMDEIEVEQVTSTVYSASKDSELQEYAQENDAWFGSYPEDLKALKNQNSDIQEVIIGTDDRRRINPTTSYPWRAICSLVMKTKTGKFYIGTGWMVGPGTVITAGHCVYFHNEGGWPEYIDVIPGRNGSLATYGTIRATSFRSVTGWTKNKNRNTDYGAIILNTKIGNTVGYFGYAYKNDSFIKSKTLNLSGYPGDKGGTTQWFHSQKVKSVNSRVITYEIDTMGGQSGSPVWYLENGNRYAIGIHTNGATGGNSATRIVKAVFDNIKNWKALGS